MSFTDEQIAALSEPLQSSIVKTRKQAGFELSYIEGWHAISEANRIFGFDGWDRETVDLKECGSPREVDGKFRVAFIARVRITVRASDGVVAREGIGFGSGIAKDLGDAYESAVKEAETDAMKRAMMTFGNQFGLALYDKDKKDVSDKLGKHALKTKLREVQTDVMNAPDEASLNDIMKHASKLIEQAKDDLPDFIYGDGGDVRGLKGDVEMMRAEFKSREAGRLGNVA